MMRLNKGIRGTRGFTLVEVMVAMAIFTVGAMALFAMQLRSISASARARRLSSATELAQYPIEAIKGTNFELLNAMYIDSHPFNYTSTDTNPGPDYDDLKLKNLMTEWWGLINVARKGDTSDPSDPKSGFFVSARGRLNVTYQRDTGDTFNKWADVTVTVEWCDNKGDFTSCETNHKHRVIAKERFVNSY